MDLHCLELLDTLENVYIGELTQLILWENPADSSHPRGRPYNPMERDLANWNKRHSAVHRVDNEMVEDVVVCVDEDRVLPRWSNKDHRRGQVFNVQNGMVAERKLPGPKAQLITLVSFARVRVGTYLV